MQPIVKYLLFTFAVGFFTSCSKAEDLSPHLKNIENLTVYPISSQPNYNIELDKQTVIGKNDTIFISGLVDIAVDDKGRIYIADGDRLNIKVYSAEGTFLTLLGRRGKGPGEFSGFSSIQVNDKKLFVYYKNTRKAELFSTDSLVYLKTIQLAANKSDFKELSATYSDRLFIRKNNSFLMKFDDPVFKKEDIERWDKYNVKSFYRLLGAKGQVMQKNIFNLVSDTRIMVPFPGTGRAVGMHIKFYKRLLMVLSQDDYIYTARTKNFLIKVYSPDGTYLRAFYYPYERVPLTRKSAVESGVAELFLDGMSSMNLPHAWPALHDMLIDDKNRLWVATIVKNQKVYQWWILNKRGKLLARFILPRNKQIKVIKDGRVYVKKENKKGISQIVEYKIQML